MRSLFILILAFPIFAEAATCDLFCVGYQYAGTVDTVREGVKPYYRTTLAPTRIVGTGKTQQDAYMTAIANCERAAGTHIYQVEVISGQALHSWEPAIISNVVTATIENSCRD